MAASQNSGLTDEEKSALKQNTNPVTSSKLKLKEPELTWWRDAKVGMFIHWGLYAIPAEGEWVMHNKKIQAKEYAKLADQFGATKFDASKWAEVAKSGGMKYMVLTARHHDGFSLWDSKSSHLGFTSLNSAAHRDIIREYTDAARKAKLRVGIYYSPMDWRFPGYFDPHGQAESAQLMKQQCYGQVRELMSQYGKIDILWYDGGWLAHSGTDADAAWLWDPIKLNTMVRELQPKAVISPRSGWEGDFSAEEGSFQSAGPIRKGPWEKCFSIGGAWGFARNATIMPFSEAIKCIVNAVVRNGNVLINVGPDPDGVIPAEQEARIAEIGTWLKKAGKSIYGVRGGPLQPVDGVYGTTYRGDRIYVHVLKWEKEQLVLPPLPQNILSSRVLTGGEVVVTAEADRTVITPSVEAKAVPVTIIELKLKGEVSFQP